MTWPGHNADLKHTGRLYVPQVYLFVIVVIVVICYYLSIMPIFTSERLLPFGIYPSRVKAAV